MKCINCHGEIENGKSACDLCGFNVSVQKKNEELVINGVNKLVKYKKITTILVIALMLSIVLSTFIPEVSFTLPFLGVVFLLPLIEKGIILGFVGFIAFMLIKTGMKNVILKRNGETVSGKVIEYNLRDRKDHIIAEYEVNGRKYRLVDEYKKYVEIGSNVTIKYNSKNPHDAIIMGNNNRGIALILGLFLVIVVVIFFFFA